jgi:DHA1 family tetracycline resistance protein-like MFS transporter
MTDTPTTPTDAPSPAGSRRSALLIVFLVVFIDLLGFGIVLPLLPLFGEEYVDALIPGGKANRAGGAILGLLMAAFSMMQFLFAPLWGRLSDRVGRRPVLLIGLVGSVVFYALLGYACMLPQTSAALALTLLFVARIGQGVSGATISTAQAVIADCTPPEKRKHGMALIGAAFGIGFTFGPLIGFLALLWFPNDHGAVGFTAAGLSFVALLLGLRLMPETRVPGVQTLEARRWFDPAAFRSAFWNPAIGPVILTFFLASLGFASFEVTLSLLNEDALGLGKQSNFLIFAYVGLVLVVAQGFLYRRMAKNLTEPTLMAIGIVLMGAGVMSLGGISYAASTGNTGQHLLPWVMVVLPLAVTGFAFLTPSAQALISRRTSADRQGEILGLNQSASALARILGPIAGLSLYRLNDTHMLPYLFGSGLLLLMLPLIPRIRRGG